MSDGKSTIPLHKTLLSGLTRNVLKVKVLVVGAVLIGKGVGFVDANCNKDGRAEWNEAQE